MKGITASALLLMVATAFGRAQGVESKPQLLPAASEFRLELKEFTDAEIAADERCGGRALETYACHAFVATLTNVGALTVRMSKLDCAEPELVVERKVPALPVDGGW